MSQALSVDSGESGRAPLTEPAARTLPADTMDGHAAFAEKEHGEEAVFRVRPERWVGTDLGSV
ncbi:hypothetical protein [Streptomyces sp. MUM 178J]|uniref:hypothetical protein n=1 Tax=Streptomyces sp. MUM 178J TaxID=2791991 RepID=UPI003FA6A405